MKLIVAVTGASGSLYAKRLIDKLSQLHSQLDEMCIVFSKSGKEVWQYELGISTKFEGWKEYENDDFFSPIASGSANYEAMIVCPCSVGTLGRIAHGEANSLITRASDVMLKERKKLILVLRETPYNLIHIKNMELLTQAGGIICPASPSFYSKPQSINDLCDTVVDKAISLCGLQSEHFEWGK